MFGIKTGVTNSAGPCLCTSIVASDKHPIPLIVVLLCCSTMDIRWMETWKLAKWAASRLHKIKQYKNQIQKPGYTVSQLARSSATGAIATANQTGALVGSTFGDAPR